MPQKTRSQKERAAARRESGQIKTPAAPAPIELSKPETGTGYDIKVPPAPTQRLGSTAALAKNNEAEFNYSYVYSDLRRIGLLAILCFGVMIALAFVLR
ncbi:MAG: hypothetical protein IT331_12620 [Anaerolineae bacterium]|nr:hypothetical protein [Anaerolineae bacterium]